MGDRGDQSFMTTGWDTLLLGHTTAGSQGLGAGMAEQIRKVQKLGPGHPQTCSPHSLLHLTDTKSNSILPASWARTPVTFGSSSSVSSIPSGILSHPPCGQLPPQLPHGCLLSLLPPMPASPQLRGNFPKSHLTIPQLQILQDLPVTEAGS